MKKIVYAPKPFEVKTFNKEELALLYKVSCHILNLWLEDIEDLGIAKGGVYNIDQVLKIIQRYGVPGQFVKLITDEEANETESTRMYKHAA